MADFFIPKKEDTTITLHDGEAVVEVDISHIQELLVHAYEESEKIGVSWADQFALLFEKDYKLSLSRTSVMLLVNQSKEMVDALKKSFSPSQSSTKGTRSRSPKI
jgi:hypothetical protein